jgi:hypothetical protein
VGEPVVDLVTESSSWCPSALRGTSAGGGLVGVGVGVVGIVSWVTTCMVDQITWRITLHGENFSIHGGSVY